MALAFGPKLEKIHFEIIDDIIGEPVAVPRKKILRMFKLHKRLIRHLKKSGATFGGGCTPFIWDNPPCDWMREKDFI